MGSPIPKQFLPLGEIPLVLYTLRPFVSHPRIDWIVLVVPEGYAAAPPEWLAALEGERLQIVPGGATRSDSVFAGLQALRPEVDSILVHDGARPLVDASLIDAVLTHVLDGRSAIAATPVRDTLKREGEGAGHDPVVLRTESRTGLWRAQTPQGFPRAILERAYAKRAENPTVGADATDDAEMVERLGEQVVLVPGSVRNLKVTTPEEFALVHALLGLRP